MFYLCHLELFWRRVKHADMIDGICANLCLDCAVDSTWEVLRVYTEKYILLENDTTISLYFRAKAVVLSRFPDM